MTANPPTNPASKPGTVTLHRILRAPADRIFRAFIEPAAMVKWLPPHGFTAQVHDMNPTVGGGYKMSFTNFRTGQSHAFGGKYVELVPNQRLRYTDRFDDPNLPGEMSVTINLRPVACGTELSIVQEGIPAAIPTEFCYLGWQESLAMLASLVEPEIP
ncbi:MAG: SRPBCC family protein [Phycisphaerales bacterium]|nr:SRPBCC family protein [Phycisphaerales bacterium]